MGLIDNIHRQRRRGVFMCYHGGDLAFFALVILDCFNAIEFKILPKAVHVMVRL
jgi:hypothetical protein